MKRFLSVVLAQWGGGRLRGGALYISLILAWHCVMSWFVYPTIDGLENRITMRMSSFWFQRGVTQTHITNLRTVKPEEVGMGWAEALLLPVIVFLLIESLLGWLGYRCVNRRPKPKWFRFARYWWGACLYATVIFPTVGLVAAAMPGAPGNDLLGISLIVGFCMYWGGIPALRGRREIVVRARRLAMLCPKCRYSLRALVEDVCPECGTRVVHSPRGGYEIRSG